MKIRVPYRHLIVLTLFVLLLCATAYAKVEAPFYKEGFGQLNNQSTLTIDSFSSVFNAVNIDNLIASNEDTREIAPLIFLLLADRCPNDPNKDDPGVCGCGVPDNDTDGDGALNCNDGCPEDQRKVDPGVCGCGNSDVDSDENGVADCIDDLTRVAILEFTASSYSINEGESAVLSWSTQNASETHIDNSVGIVPLEGSQIVTPEHTTTYTLTVSGSNGNDNAKITVNVQGNPAEPGEGSFGEKYVNLIPEDATIDAYDDNRFSIVTGFVHDIMDNPMSEVSVTIHQHFEYGTSITDAQGRFAIPVEAGGDYTTTLVYQKEGFITTHRKIYVPFNDVAVAETVRMIAEDSQKTEVTFDGNPETVVTHKSSVIDDSDGTRACTMVFTGDNQALAVDESGNDILELTSISARATEFTTPESMPAELPPTSAFTYCAELKVDGIERVRFEKPVVTWVDNFLGFEVGEIVPVGYYDRDRGVWVPSENGVVVKLLDTNGDSIVDALDADGDDTADDLNDNGSFDDEVQGLSDSTTYIPGTTYWRVPVSHFTPWDFNWPYGPPEDAIPPNPEYDPIADEKDEDYDEILQCLASAAEIRNRIYHTDVSIPGTGLTMHYDSSRTAGYQSVITVPVSGDTVPDSLNSIVARVDVAGVTYTQTLPALPNQKTEFVWDKRNFQGESVTGARANIKIGFVYDAVYYSSTEDFSNAFAQVGSIATNIRARREVIFWKVRSLNLSSTTIGGGESGEWELAEGWTISGNHRTDGSFLHKGNGAFSTNKNIGGIIATVAGNGDDGYNGDNIPATQASMTPVCVYVTANKNILICDHYNRLRKIDTNGIITTIAGNGFNGGSLQDNIPAIEARVLPNDVHVDVNGNIFISSYHNLRIRKIDTNGIITTVAGNGAHIYNGDNIPATEAGIYPVGLHVDAEGNIYIADFLNYRIRKIDTNGIITTVAGNGVNTYNGDNIPATEAGIYPTGLHVDAEGNIYIADHFNYRIRKVSTNGIITTVAGNGVGVYNGDNIPATEASISPVDVHVDAERNIYIADHSNSRIRRISTNGIITTVAGNGVDVYNGDNIPATEANIDPYKIHVDQSGNIFITDFNHRIRKVTYQLSSHENSTNPFPESSSITHMMSNTGKHLETIDTETGVSLNTFEYDENDRLISITDRFNNETTIERDSNTGKAVAIISPYGQRTELNIGANGLLQSITLPDRPSHEFIYHTGGLMAWHRKPGGNESTNDYTTTGRLLNAYDQEGGHWHFPGTTNDEGSISVTSTSAEGVSTTYTYGKSADGIKSAAILNPNGESSLTVSYDGSEKTSTTPSGMIKTTKSSVDPEYNYHHVKGFSYSTPEGLEITGSIDGTYEDTNSDGEIDVIVKTVNVNEKTLSTEHDLSAATKTVTTPEGRTRSISYDPTSLLPVSINIPGIDSIEPTFDSQGRIKDVSQGTRKATFTYDTNGFLETITTPKLVTTRHVNDKNGLIKEVHRPDNTITYFDYDDDGNLSTITSPSGSVYGFTYNKRNQLESYITPLSESFIYVYNNDGQLSTLTHPSGKTVSYQYEDGLLDTVASPNSVIDYDYLCCGKISSATRGDETINFEYDGDLLKSVELTGTLDQKIEYTLNNDFDITSISYAGGLSTILTDKDGLLTGIGDFTITRNSSNGFPESVTDASYSMTRAFNNHGEIVSQVISIENQDVISWNLIRDDIGMISQKTETIGGQTSEFIYNYDAVGRLISVTKDGDVVETYRYDQAPLGICTYEENDLRGIAGRSFHYDAEYKIEAAGNTTYHHNKDGFLESKIDVQGTTSYSYALGGELLSVNLPGGDIIEYIHDPAGRRIAKKVNDTITRKYLWQGRTQLLAVYDGADNLLMRFNYADTRVPVTMQAGGVTYYLAYDQVDSLRVVTDASGTIVKQITYDSFGNVINDTNPSLEIPLGFAGGLYDQATGLIRFGYRDYDPDVHRWTAKDPVLFADGNIDLYGYVLNDPIRYIDSTGLVPDEQIPPVQYEQKPARLWDEQIVFDSLGFETYKKYYEAKQLFNDQLKKIGTQLDDMGYFIDSLIRNPPQAPEKTKQKLKQIDLWEVAQNIFYKTKVIADALIDYLRDILDDERQYKELQKNCP